MYSFNRISHAEFHCDRLTVTVQYIQDYVSFFTVYILNEISGYRTSIKLTSACTSAQN